MSTGPEIAVRSAAQPRNRPRQISLEGPPMESWSAAALRQLSAAQQCGYRVPAPTAAEPAALAAMALVAHDALEPADVWCAWLTAHQAPGGGVGINLTDADPCWPTALACIAWRAHDAAARQTRYARQIAAGTRWLLRVAGLPVTQTPAMGHNSRLIGWPWVPGTHSWIEPTAWAVMALKAVGQADHPRTREAVTLLIDRLIPTGGCNYGNTAVLGQQLRPHLQPTGITLLALADEKDPGGRIDASLDYLSRNLNAETPAASLAYGLLGLTAWERAPQATPEWLAAAYQRQAARESDPHHLALLLLAAAGKSAAPILFCRRGQ